METVRQKVVEFLREAMRRLEVKTPTALAKKAGLAPSTINRFWSDPNRASIPRTDTLAKIASKAGMPLSIEILPLSPASIQDYSLETVPVVGAVQAGEWITRMALPDEKWQYISVPPTEEEKSHKRFGLRVSDNSFNKVCPIGSIVICIYIDDIGRHPNSGEYVVVHRANGPLLEVTIKEYVTSDDGSVWLWPRSDDPRFQEPWQFIDAGGRRASAFKVVALVDAIYRSVRDR